MTDSHLLSASSPGIPRTLTRNKTTRTQPADRQPEWFPLCWVLPHHTHPQPGHLQAP